MATFLTILGVLIAVNVALLVHSSLYGKSRSNVANSPQPEQPAIKIYPLDWLPSYKRAV